eukprot:COSAG04_NODE_534_length_12949_cov_5.651673_14_plen_244_part_00
MGPVSSGPLPTWSISSGPCTVSTDGSCFRTPGYPEFYSGPEANCTLDVDDGGVSQPVALLFSRAGDLQGAMNDQIRVAEMIARVQARPAVVGGDSGGRPMEICFVPAATCTDRASPSQCTGFQCETVLHGEALHLEAERVDGLPCDDGDPLTKDGKCRWDGTCAFPPPPPPPPCTTPASLTGYDVDEVELNPAYFAIRASCAEGYAGTPTVRVCGEGGGEYTLGGCHPPVACQSAISCALPTN